MFIAYVIVTCATILANLAIVVADLTGAEFVVANMTEVGLSRSSLPVLATLKGAGVAGLLLGLLGAPIIGIAAALGLVAFFTGALVTHVRARVFYNIAVPGAYFLLALASLTLAFMS